MPAFGLTLQPRPGETINVGFSAKFDPQALAGEPAGHGLVLEHHWLDTTWDYGIFLARKKR